MFSNLELWQIIWGFCKYMHFMHLFWQIWSPPRHMYNSYSPSSLTGSSSLLQPCTVSWFLLQLIHLCAFNFSLTERSERILSENYRSKHSGKSRMWMRISHVWQQGRGFIFPWGWSCRRASDREGDAYPPQSVPAEPSCSLYPQCVSSVWGLKV